MNATHHTKGSKHSMKPWKPPIHPTYKTNKKQLIIK